MEASLEKANIVPAHSDYAFGANLYDESGMVSSMMNIRCYSDMPLDQPTTALFTSSEVQEIDRALENAMRTSGQAAGFQILEWRGTKKIVVNGYTMLLTEYKRSPIQNNGNFVVRLARILNGPKSFTVTVSYRENQEKLLRQIGDKIIASIRSLPCGRAWQCS